MTNQWDVHVIEFARSKNQPLIDLVNGASPETVLDLPFGFVLAQNGEQVGLPMRCPLIGQQDLKPLSGDRGGTLAPKQIEEPHAALRPNSLSNKPLRSLGMFIGTSAPLSLRAASR